MNTNNNIDLNNQEYIKWIIESFLPSWFKKIFDKSMGILKENKINENTKKMRNEWIEKRKKEWIETFFLWIPNTSNENTYLYKPIFLIDTGLIFYIPLENVIKIKKCIIPLINISKSHNECVKEIYEVLNTFFTFIFQQIPGFHEDNQIKIILKDLIPMHCFVDNFKCKSDNFFFIQKRAIWLKTKVEELGFIYFTLIPRDIYDISKSEYISLNADTYILEYKIEGDNLDFAFIQKLIEDENKSDCSCEKEESESESESESDNL